jgi:RND family efflux transporter MFP subunit
MSDKSRKILIPLVIIILGITGMVILLKAHPEAEQIAPEVYKPLVRSQTVSISGAQITITSQGTVEPRTQSSVLAQVGGQVVSVSPHFAPGGYFKKGEVMLSIDPSDYRLAKIKAELLVAQAELRLAREQEEAKLAKEEWEKTGSGEASDLVLRKPQLKEAEASLNAAQAGLEQTRLNLGRTEIKAPYDCRVRTKNADEGSVVNPGAPVAIVYAIDFAEIRLPLPDADLAFIETAGLSGAKRNTHLPEVELTGVFAGKSHSWHGKIVRMEGEIDPRSRMVHVVARVDDPYGQRSGDGNYPLSVGMFVTANISGRKYDGVVSIDRAALRGSNTVWVIDDENKLHLREIEILRQEKGRVLVSAGLRDGEKICLTALDAVTDGMEVKVQE